MTVKAYLALLVGVFVVALVAVSVVQRDLAGNLAGVARDVTRSHAPRARAAHELRAAHLAERRALAGFLLAAEPAESARLQQARRDLRRWRGDLGAHLTQEDQASLAEIDRLVAEEQAAADQAVELRRSGRAAEARELGGREADPPGERVDELLAQLSDTTSRELDADAARAERTAAAAGRRTVLLPLLVILAVAGFALWVVRRVLHDLARPFHAAGLNIRSNADRLSAAVQQLAATTAEQSSGVAQTSATMEELARAAASIAETVDHVASQAGTTRDNLEQAQYDIRASGERTPALADRVGEVGVTIALINEIAGAQSESNATVANMERSARQMQEGLSLLGEVADATAQVRLTTQQQRSATEQVVVTMAQISSSSRQVSATAHQIARSADQLASLAADLEQTASPAGEPG